MCYHADEGLPARVIAHTLGHGLFGVPHGEASHDHPQDGHLVQQLAEQGQRGVEVGRGRAHDDQQQPNLIELCEEWLLSLTK